MNNQSFDINTEEQQEPIATPANNSRLIGISSVAIAMILVGVVSFYLGTLSNRGQLSTTPQPSFVPGTNQQQNTEPVMETTVPAGWETYLDDAFSFSYPAGGEIDHQAAGEGVDSVRVSFMGPKQVASGRTQTELFDGYSVTITNIGSASEKSLEQFASESHQSQKDSCQFETAQVSNLEITQLPNGLYGQQFKTTGCYGDSTQTFVEHNSYVYHITQIYTGEGGDQTAYQETTQQILKSLRFK